MNHSRGRYTTTGYAIRAACVLCAISTCYGQTFSISVAPSSLTIYPGQQNVPVTLTASASAGSGPITVSLSGLPSGIAASPLTLKAGASGTLTLNASLSAGQEGFPPTGPSMQTSWTAAVTVIAASASAQVTSPLALTVSISNPSFAPAASAINLPVVNINTKGVPIADKTTDVPGTITITSADSQTSYLPSAADSDNTANFHLHGNSTILMPKVPYHISLTTSVDLLGLMGLQCPYVTDTKANPVCDKSKSYILLANYDDKTLLRTWSASLLARSIPIGNGYLNSPANSPTPSGTSALMPWAPHSLYVELFLNGAYQGDYQLIEEVKVDAHRVNVNKLADTDTAANQITGGYLLEISAHEDAAYVFVTPQQVPIGLEDPDFSPDPEVPEQTSYISTYVDGAESALFGANYTDPTKGWRAWFDEASAVNLYIVNDLMGNVDGGDFYNSIFMYKDANNPLIYMGPVWDFDISSGNVNYYPIVNPTVPWMQTHAIWYAQWFTDAGFKADVVKQWNALKQNGVFTTWLASIQRQATTLEQSQANNFARWPMLGMEVWPNPQAAGSYDGEVAYFLNWLNLRIGYLDSVFNQKAQTSVTLGTLERDVPVGSPLSLTAYITGGANPTGVVSFLAGGVIVGVAPVNNGMASLAVGNLAGGPARIQAVYNGDSSNAISYSAIRGGVMPPSRLR